ncbi:MAG TPA: hypothetical protein PK156_23405 [Polyangium sp.]|nr:hypothetical protein [Polyangium sp.]
MKSSTYIMARQSSSLASLPVEFRLPNPPAIFCGRRQEIQWLRKAFARGPVTVVEGEGGFGKSALTHYVLHTRFPERIESALFISLRDRVPDEFVALSIARALVLANGLRDFDWSELLASPEALTTLAIDLADTRERWVLLDDLHHCPAAEVAGFLRQACRYARRSKWIVTTRFAPRIDELTGQVLSVNGGMYL